MQISFTGMQRDSSVSVNHHVGMLSSLPLLIRMSHSLKACTFLEKGLNKISILTCPKLSLMIREAHF